VIFAGIGVTRIRAGRLGQNGDPMKKKYIVAHDMGTSADKAILVDMTGIIIEQVKESYPLYHPEPDHAEQEPEDLWRAVCRTTRELLRKGKISADQVAGITFSSQTQSLIPVDSKGTPLRRSFNWLDGRSADIIREKLWTRPRIKGYHIFRLLKFLAVTGGAPGHTGKDQIGKILWYRRHEPDLFARTDRFLDAKDYILFRLTGQMVISSDLASIWWMLDTRKKPFRWHEGLTRMAGITPDLLPEVRESGAIVGPLTDAAADATGLKEGTPVINGAGDLSAAALGSGALEDGAFHVCIGTSGWVAGHVTRRKIDLPHYAGCIGSALPDRYYLAMAHQETAGICLEWLKNNILYHKDRLIKEARVEEIFQILDELAAASPPGAESLVFTPWMYGERCPVDDDHVRASLMNLGLNHRREHVVRAVFEGIAMNTRWAMETLEKLYKPVTRLNFIGGGAKSDIWCQILADVTDRIINRVADPEQAGARGVALLAAVTLGYIDSVEKIQDHIQIDRRFVPRAENRRLYDRLFREFKNVYRQNKRWYRRMNRRSSD